MEIIEIREHSDGGATIVMELTKEDIGKTIKIGLMSIFERAIKEAQEEE